MRNPLTLEAFAEWCERKPAEERYDYKDACGCAYHQYLQETGFAVLTVGPTYWNDTDFKEHDLLDGLNRALNPPSGDWTFGALAARLRETTGARAR